MRTDEYPWDINPLAFQGSRQSWRTSPWTQMDHTSTNKSVKLETLTITEGTELIGSITFGPCNSKSDPHTKCARIHELSITPSEADIGHKRSLVMHALICLHKQGIQEVCACTSDKKGNDLTPFFNQYFSEKNEIIPIPVTPQHPARAQMHFTPAA